MNRDLKVRGGAAAVLLILFATGAALGIAVGREQRPGDAETLSTELRLPTGLTDPPHEWIIDRLGLSPVQRTAVDSVVAHYGVRMSSLQKEYRPRYHAIVDSASQALRALLTEVQRARYDSLQAAAKRGFEDTPEREVP